MLSDELKNLVVQPAWNMIIIWGAFMAATLIYVFVAWIMFRGANPELDASFSPRLVQAVIWFLVLVSAMGSVIIEKVMLSEKEIMKKLGQDPNGVTALTSQSLSGRPVSAEKKAIFENLSGTEQRLICLLSHYRTAMIVVWALRESIAVLGLILVILMGDFLMVVPFAMVALVLIAIRPPRPASFLEANRNRAQNFG